MNVTWSPSLLSTRVLENVVVAMATMPFTAGSGGAIDEYQSAIDAFAPGTPPGPALALGWVAGKLFEEAVTRAVLAGGAATPENLIEALRGFRDETLGRLTTPLNYSPDGTRNRNCYFGMQGDGTGNGYALPNGTTPVCP